MTPPPPPAPAPDAVSVSWYRTPLPPGAMKKLHARSDWRGGLQTLGYLAVLLLTGSAAFYAWRHASAWVWLPLVFLHGTVFAFQINAVHELGHGTVFRTSRLNALFVRVFAFLGWINFLTFNASHTRHHRYTLHPPDDLEVVLPMRMMVRHFFLQGFVQPLRIVRAVREQLRVARGGFAGEWELALFPVEEPEKRKPPMRWARFTLAGHAAIVVFSIWQKLWLLPLLTTFAPFYGGWLFFLCNNTQHIGLQDNVPDFRLCCRTFTLNPAVRFLYWQMNYHIEHHMYAAVPCYNLEELHRLIRHDLAPCPHGLAATWREIAAIQKIQEANPGYQHAAPVPGGAKSEAA